MAQHLPHAVVAMMGSREHRLHHYLWHNVRNNWLKYTDQTRNDIKDLGWEPPRPSRTLNNEAILENRSGEDFLYMHREMISAVNRRLATIGDPAYPKIDGWNSVPPPDDPEWPVPPPFPIPGVEDYLVRVKSDDFFYQTIRPLEQTYTDQKLLKRITLGELGARIEYTIHDMMHMRWCAPVSEIRPENNDNAPDAIDPKWDDLNYDWLGDTYSSHVNPVFWKLHGWVDRRIDDWASANGVQGDIQWTGTWTGPFPTSPPSASLFAEIIAMRSHLLVQHNHGGHDHNHLHTMTEVARLVRESRIECHFYDQVGVPPLT